MFFRLTRYRLKTEWQKILGVALCGLLLTWASVNNYTYTSKKLCTNYTEFERYYGEDYLEWGRERLAMGFDMEPEELGETPGEAFEAIRRVRRGLFYVRLIQGSEGITAVLIFNALAALLLTGLFSRRRLGPLTAAGFSRGRLFLSLTLSFYAAVFLLWRVCSAYAIRLYGVVFAPEERDFYAFTQLSWFLSFLFLSSIAYLSAMLLRRPLYSFLAALGIWFLLRFLLGTDSPVPVCFLGTGLTVKAWDPGADLSKLSLGNYISLGTFLLAVLLGWLRFRKGGLE